MSSPAFTTPNLSSGSIVSIDKQKTDDYHDLTSLLKRALNKLANSHKYNGIVEDIHAFVNVFDERTPEYVQRLGYAVVLEEATKLYEWKRL